MARLIDLATILRSKNAGPGVVTLDVMFDNKDNYDRVKESGVLTKELIAEIYNTDPQNVDIIMYWLILIVAGVFEVGWAIGVKYTHGFTRFWPSVGTLVAIMISMGLLGVAMKTLPTGTAYAVWVGIGIVGAATLGIFLFDESVNIFRLISLGVIVAGIIGLKLSTP